METKKETNDKPSNRDVALAKRELLDSLLEGCQF